MLKRIIAALSIISTLSGCSLLTPEQPATQQGNILTQSQVNRIQEGMTKQQVIRQLGSPVMTNTFNNNRLDYVYTREKNKKVTDYNRLTILFKHGKASKIIKTKTEKPQQKKSVLISPKA